MSKYDYMTDIMREMFEQVDQADIERELEYWTRVDYEYERWKEENDL